MVRYIEVAPTKIVRAGSDVFTYACDDAVLPGHLVTIPVGKQTLTGLVIRETKQPSYATKDIISIIEPTPLPPHSIEIALWLSAYYQTPLATVLQTLLPRGLTTKRRPLPKKKHAESNRNRTTIVFTDEQQKAITSIMQMPSGTSLLQGVTGSGKTEIYKEIARRIAAEGRSTIILVPEIGLTQQAIDEFVTDFPDAVVTHSQMTESERHHAWRQVLEATKPCVVIGPRSALFLPVQNLGAVIIDEAHEPSYKQEQAPRYSALRVASMYGTYCQARIVFGSATPLIADRFTAETHKAPIIRLSRPARQEALPATVSVVDMTHPDNRSTHRSFSPQLLHEIERTLAEKQQVLLFHNRRGSASTTLCESCGWSALCSRCFVPFILHEDSFSLVCHVCSATEKVPTSCPDCQSATIIHKGVGTKRLASELARLFPQAVIARFDSDNRPSETLQARYKELYDGSVDIIIGTQVVAKGLDLPHLQTVGVIQADSGLALPDFMATERTFQLLAQVVGRVGRDHRETAVVVQTYQASHPVITFGVQQDYEGFYQYALAERRRAKFPPYHFLLQLTTVYKTEAAAIRACRTLADSLRQQLPAHVEILGPTPAFYERQHGTYRWQLILKSTQRKDLIEAMKHVPLTHWQAELDPASLL